MRKQFYLPNASAERVIWLQNFILNLPTYAPKYNITPTEIADMQQCSSFLAALIAYYESVGAFSKAFRTYKEDMMNTPGTFMAPQAPAAPAAINVPLAAGIFARVSAVVNKIKTNPAYNEQDGKDLGIEGTEQESRPTAEEKPVISTRPASGGAIEIVWTKSSHSAIEIESSTDGGQTWQFLAVDTSPNYTDTTPATGPQKRSYRAIYRDNDTRTGQWSDIINALVG